MLTMHKIIPAFLCNLTNKVRNFPAKQTDKRTVIDRYYTVNCIKKYAVRKDSVPNIQL